MARRLVSRNNPPHESDEVVAMSTVRQIVAWILVCMLLSPPLPVTGQDASKVAFKPEELDQLVAPIALHPDPLLAQILMASTYPLEVVQAARFAKDNAKLTGEQLDEALKQQTWDDSVKSLVTFPQVLTMMNDKLDWLQKLGDAFLSQQQDLMASVQRLRARAQAAGQLKSTKEQKVIVEPAASVSTAPPPPPAGAAPAAPAPTSVQVVQPASTVIMIEPANPQVVYVPSYNPTVVYGAWPPAYPPYYPYPPGYFAATAFTFAAGVAVGAALWGNCNWGHGDVTINNNNYNSFTSNVNNTNIANNRKQNISGQTPGGQGKWQHNPEHRKGVQYRDAATQQRFNKTGPANAQAREQFRGRTQQAGLGQGSAGTRQTGLAQGGGGIRETGGSALGQGGAGTRQTAAGNVGQGGGFGQGGGRQAGAFEGVGQSRDTQNFSNRGNASRESFKRSSAAPGAGGGGGGRAGGGGGGRAGGRR